jgi:hypothetical protein
VVLKVDLGRYSKHFVVPFQGFFLTLRVISCVLERNWTCFKCKVGCPERTSSLEICAAIYGCDIRKCNKRWRFPTPSYCTADVDMARLAPNQHVEGGVSCNTSSPPYSNRDLPSTEHTACSDRKNARSMQVV